MADSRAKFGYLVPLKNNHEEDDSASPIPLFQGLNVMGRNDLFVSDKRVSRKHVTLKAMVDGLVEVVVEGPNPIVIQSASERKKLSSQERVTIVHGDTLEMIPGRFLFKYKALAPESFNEEEALSLKRKRQVVEDEAFAQSLQDELWNDSYSSSNAKRAYSSVSETVASSPDSLEPIRHFSVSKEKIPLIFRLLRVQGIPTWANTSSVCIGDVIQGNVLVAVLSNYMVDMDWLMSACPTLRKVPHVLVIHGESGASLDHMKKSKPSNWFLHQPPLPISYGTHHSKAMLLVYPHGIRVIIHTANLINVDWNNKSQGLWMQDFPLKDKDNHIRGSSFENDLIDYLSALRWPEFSVSLPSIGNVNINASFFKKFDYSSAAVRLIASVPGYHTGSNLKKWGHMKLREILQGHIFNKEFKQSPIVYQFSSLGSLDEKWMAELALSMSSGFSEDQTPLGLGKAQIIWPTTEDVRCSLEGYAAGNAIPSPQKNVNKDFLKKYWARWKANHSGRCRAMPHIKTYTRYNGQDLAWFLLTSANLSKAAWGALQKNNSQIMIRSYELGVLFLPSKIRAHGSEFSCTESGGPPQSKRVSTGVNETDDCKTKLATLCWRGNRSTDTSTHVIKLPIPYQIPPEPYTSADIPWSWDRTYTKKDIYGQVWPRHVQLYSDPDS